MGRKLIKNCIFVVVISFCAWNAYWVTLRAQMWIRFQLVIHHSNYVEEKYFYNLWIRVDGVCSLFLKLYTIGDSKGRRSGIVSAKCRETSTAQNDGKMCKQCSELTETYRDEEIHPRYHVCYFPLAQDLKSSSHRHQHLKQSASPWPYQGK